MADRQKLLNMFSAFDSRLIYATIPIRISLIHGFKRVRIVPCSVIHCLANCLMILKMLGSNKMAQQPKQHATTGIGVGDDSWACNFFLLNHWHWRGR